MSKQNDKFLENVEDNKLENQEESAALGVDSLVN
jgi:hypothetical protein